VISLGEHMGEVDRDRAAFPFVMRHAICIQRR
jgi:hypothetical protein